MCERCQAVDDARTAVTDADATVRILTTQLVSAQHVAEVARITLRRATAFFTDTAT